MKRPLFHDSRGMTGVSLVELMIAMAIGLLLLSAVGYVYLGSRQTFRGVDNLSRIQENYRYAVDQLSQDVRMAGYAGCINLVSLGTRGMLNPLPATSPDSLALSRGIQAYAGAGAWPGPAPAPANYVPGTDVLRITAAGANATNLINVMNSPAGPIPVNTNPAGLAAGDRAIVSDCKQADIFSVAAAGAGAITPAAPVSTLYGLDAEVLPFIDTIYYIGLNPGGNPSLYRIRNGVTDEMVENVERMVLRFGLDTDGEFDIDNYQAAGGVANWQQVMAVRVNLVFRGGDAVATNVAPYVLEGVATVPGDNRLRQVATVTVSVRNQIP